MVSSPLSKGTAAAAAADSSILQGDGSVPSTPSLSSGRHIGFFGMGVRALFLGRFPPFCALVWTGCLGRISPAAETFSPSCASPHCITS